MASLPQEINPEAAAHTKQRINVEISRTEGDVVLRDDPEAKAAFLSTFTSEEEKAIMHKVNKRFFVLIGLMYMIKQVCFLLLLEGTKANSCRLTLSTLLVSRCYRLDSQVTS
jgi:hypothetical protein